MTDPGRRVVGLVGGGSSSRSLVPLLALVGVGSEIVSWKRHRAAAASLGRPEVDALMVADVNLLAGLPPVPTAVVVSSWDQLHRAADHGVEVVICFAGPSTGSRRPELDSRRSGDLDDRTTDGGSTDGGSTDGLDLGSLADGGAVIVARHGLDTSRHPVLPPLVRSRLRQLHGLPKRFLVEVNGAGSDELASTSLALASAAVVTGPRLGLALALGTPVVTFDADVDRLDLHPGVEVEVAGSTLEADALVAELADDEPRAAAASRRARRFAESHLDLGHPAQLIRRRLALPEPGPVSRPDGGGAGICLGDPAQVMAARLRELQTPRSARITGRADLAVDGLRP